MALGVVLLASGCKKDGGGEAETVAPPSGEATGEAEAVVDEAPEATDPPPPPPPGTRGEERALTTPAELSRAVAELDEWATKKKGHARVAIFDAESASWVVEFGADEVDNPASTQKILTAAASLELLGPAFTWKTELLGKLEGQSAPRLALRGDGAPDFTTADLWRLARVLGASGVTEVGAITVDQSRFTDAFVPPAFDQQPNEWAAFRAPISAVALDRNAVTLHVASTRPSEPARFWYEPPGLVDARGSIETSAVGSGDRVTWSLRPQAGSPRLTSEVGGSLASGLGRRRYSRRLDDPRLAPGFALRALLEEQKIRVTGEVSLGPAGDLPLLSSLPSAPLATVVRALGKESDNFTAEMLLVALGRLDRAAGEKKNAEPPWSSERGATVLRRWLAERGLEAPGVRIENGSGLFDANRLSPRLLVRVLRLMLESPATHAEFLAQLASGGQDGTLRSRFGKGVLAGRVRAKTGTLRDTSALAGYVLRPEGKPPLVFAVLLSGVAGRHDEARQRIDKVLETLVKKLGP